MAGQRLLGWELAERRNDWMTLAKAMLSEFVGTLLFVFIATGCITSGCHVGDVASASGNAADSSLKNVEPGSCFLQSTTVLNIALSFGFTLFVIIYFTASFSGGHINPAVTLGMFLTQKITFMRGLLYTIAQCLGAAVGSGVLKGLDEGGYRAAGGGANALNTAAGVTQGTAIGYEIILTFALVFVVFAATDAERAVSTAPLPILAPLSIGMIVFACHLVAIPIDGCSINPARSFGPALVAESWHNYWIFWVGPYTGAIIASVMYELLFRTRGMAGDGENVHVVEVTRDDIEKGMPPPSYAPKPVHTGITGLNEKKVTPDNASYVVSS